MGEVAYLVQGADLRCSSGSASSPLMLPVSHGVYCVEKSVMRQSDCLPGANILPFGICAVTQLPCAVAIVGQWMKPYTQTLVNGIPALTVDSFLVCGVGGLIKPENSGQV